MSKTLNVTKTPGKKVLMVVSNPSVSTTVGGPVGFWASELIHAWYAFVEAGYEATIASPKGGKVAFDSFSDPRDASGYSAEDILSMGFIHTPRLMALLENTPSIDCYTPAHFDAIVVAGGQGPMFTFLNEHGLHTLLAGFYEAGKVTAALCHGVCALLYVKLSDGSHLIAGKTMTGFANVEEDFADSYVGQPVMPFRIEDEAKKLGANFITGGLFKEFAVRDGRLVTGQQQYSGAATAHLVIEALGV
ncbi:type 1 glutamine amidotransferase domain-containing protein [Anthocerotibacter panamensis]|uniref:type 1 glutamine amidotransferase domain-containing protein n=1 Tax=Anthocerotibacter panamensis TaxID=2857077 RepID=UPI001C40198E|nr:type 1 glutamine amidotransferase domain-containing protein [Anthocerotibacter panamensis]